MQALFRSWLWKIAFGVALLLLLLALVYALILLIATLTHGVQV